LLTTSIFLQPGIVFKMKATERLRFGGHLNDFFTGFFVFSFVISTQHQQVNIVHETATLSLARGWLAATSSGELVFFGGGQNATGVSDRVDIYNVTNGQWTTATLSVPRGSLVATSAGSLVFFAGGVNSTTPCNQVDIYNISDGSWSTATLSQARRWFTATSVGTVALFGGGATYSGPSDAVDIYNVTSNTWTNATLSVARWWPSAVSIFDRAFFAGGQVGITYYDVVDVYNATSGTWSVLNSNLIQPRGGPAAVAIEDLILFAFGETVPSCQGVSGAVDIYNVTNFAHFSYSISPARCFPAIGKMQDLVLVAGGGDNMTSFDAIDIYNATSRTWFTSNMTLSQPRFLLASTSLQNKIFFGGGTLNWTLVSDVVDIFMVSFPETPTQPITLPHGFPVEAVVGIVVGSLALLIAVGFVLFLILFIKRRKRKTNRIIQQNIDNSVIAHKNDAVTIRNAMNTVTLSECEVLGGTLSLYQPGTEIKKELSIGQISMNELEIGKEIGEGCYGRVCVGKWKRYRVALKFCQNKGKMDEFMREANLMISLPPHPNVVRMYGVSTDGTQPIIVMEYCAGGSLDKVLYDTEEHISDEQKIRWVHEIALGMCHLHKHNIVHRDLAARNVLLSRPYLNDAHLKISVFGMSRVLQQDIESRTLNRIGPIRWMAPESIRDQVYSKKSDVWMFGILVYEIVAQCEPHVDIDPSEVSFLIRDEGLSPTIPSNCPQKLRKLMQMCWKMQPEQRPVSLNMLLT